MSISTSINSAKANVQKQVSTAYEITSNAVKNGLNKASNGLNAAFEGAKKVAGISYNAGKQGVQIVTSPVLQREKVFSKVRGGIDYAYSQISEKSNKLNKFLENEAENALKAPIKGMKELKLKRFEINETDSKNQVAVKKFANNVIKYHEDVAHFGEAFSRNVGEKVHGLVEFALSPIRFIAKTLQIEVAGALIQNSIALAVGFAVRGIVLALSQLGHLVPYIAAAAVIGGVAAALAALAIKVSPLVALGVGLGLILLGQQAQIAILSNEVNDLANQIRADKKLAAEKEAQAKEDKAAYEAQLQQVAEEAAQRAIQNSEENIEEAKNNEDSFSKRFFQFFNVA